MDYAIQRRYFCRPNSIRFLLLMLIILPPLQDLKLEFKLQSPKFLLTGTGNFKYELTSFELYMASVCCSENNHGII